MKAEDQYVIEKRAVWIGLFYAVSDHVIKSEEDIKYHNAKKEDRYIIWDAKGTVSHPHLVYSGTKNDLSFCPCISQTRQYARELDKTYFKFYDDAEEVLNNIKAFISWMRKIPDMKIKGRKKLIKKYLHLTEDVTPTQGWEKIHLNHGLNVKKRSDLAPFKRHTQDELDLIQ